MTEHTPTYQSRPKTPEELLEDNINLRAINRDLLAALERIKEWAAQRYSASKTGLTATDKNLDAIEIEAQAAIKKAKKEQ